ncbi:DNA-binding NarL/FixJ family response regulator [Clostridium saccharoperbutylacetonicum]|uniref:Stage 0 sporulation protein A homolog n=1 Tax=Clostridium saccharoperbutylacetonicum N1-4(HMT) TaxID=931276 RepID=M1MJE5_9CLOT|nr:MULTISPECIES: response regulator transcription factor [Clostridium]AGF54971.1 Two-component response regulator [Clostridium saccharoperbutylacetonicum N1-4(HMT)]NRT64322.1 DNA-binding NarL/FixJ family response regulator [Clostridium saccharoperbutylacetonicum]NSB27691.1 DNA-binding NarL/FixJ family response regulator [Clostridium saccharoperbutylacetonicum]NSB41178.1 DNA-binding NarL/FixJ family response regulator [Clostridium saccharoperbutylacetonicum]
MKDEVIKILIADDHDIIRQGLKRIISFEEDMNIDFEAENGEKALKLLNMHELDVVILDCNMPIMNGIEILRSIKVQGDKIKVIMLTVENDRNTINTAINIGADGYMLKDSAGTEIVNAIRTVHKGEKYIDKSLVSILFSDMKIKDKKVASVLDKLSRREVEVLIKISKGLSNKEIGEQLYLSEKTIKNYATNLFRKINVEDRVKATIFAIENNIKEYYISKYED